VIDTLTEAVFPLSQAVDELPRRRRGRKTNISTLYRWSQAGCRGVVLETIQIGGTRCTSREALQRFFERLSQPQETIPAAGCDPSPPSAFRSPARRQRECEQAGRALEKLGA
jgi:hypothetical protein